MFQQGQLEQGGFAHSLVQPPRFVLRLNDQGRPTVIWGHFPIERLCQSREAYSPMTTLPQ
jgi:hypothetical protein